MPHTVQLDPLPGLDLEGLDKGVGLDLEGLGLRLGLGLWLGSGLQVDLMNDREGDPDDAEYGDSFLPSDTPLLVCKSARAGDPAGDGAGEWTGDKTGGRAGEAASDVAADGAGDKGGKGGNGHPGIRSGLVAICCMKNATGVRGGTNRNRVARGTII